MKKKVDNSKTHIINLFFADRENNIPVCCMSPISLDLICVCWGSDGWRLSRDIITKEQQLDRRAARCGVLWPNKTLMRIASNSQLNAARR